METLNVRILLVDGFAEPGEYEKGEEGSPIIALRSLLEYKAMYKSFFQLTKISL